MEAQVLHWRELVLSFLSTTTIIIHDKDKIRLRKTAADLIHDIGYFFDHENRDRPGSMTPALQLAITAAVISYIRERC